MSYIETQRLKAVGLRDELFKDPGGGIFKKFEREFVLKDPSLNVFAGIRDDVVAYFNKYSIPFWDSGKEPTGHLLSSQIACINHLFFLRQREDISTAILQGIDPDVKTALRVDEGFVEFEVIGEKNHLGEKGHTRGANSTSVDAVMLAELQNGKRKLFFIEWKYVEQYKHSPSKALGESGQTRLRIYSPLLKKPDSPLKDTNLEGLYTEPFYQLMRQTLLANEMVKANEYGASDYLHLHVIPTENKELKEVNTALGKLEGSTLQDTWTTVLKSPHRYKAVDPKDFLEPVKNCLDTKTVINYLEQRYWNEQL